MGRPLRQLVLLTISTTNSAAVPSEQGSTSDSPPIVAGVVAAVAGAAVIALAVFLKKRGASTKKTANPPPAVPSTHDGNGNPEQGRDQPPHVRPSTTVVVAGGNEGNKSPSHQHNASILRDAPVETDGAGGGEVVLPSAPASQYAKNGAAAGLAGEDDAAGGSEEKKSLPATASITTASTAAMSTADRDEIAQFHQNQCVANDGTSVSGGPEPGEASGGDRAGAPAATGRNNSASDIGLGNAVLAAAQELARSCQIPGVSEAAGAVCMMVNLTTDSRENVRASEVRLRQCRTVVLALKRAAKVADTVS